MPPASLTELGLPFEVSADRFTGGAAVSVAFDLPDGRNAMAPRLGLSYGSPRQRGVFGRGWSLTGLPVIGVAEDGGLPRYDARTGYSSSLGGPLVVARDGATGEPIVHDRGAFRVHRYRAQIDNARIRFERWVERATGRVHWRTRDTANTLTIYGADPANLGRIADPADPARVYQWLPEIQVAATGDAIRFHYAAEDLRGGAGARMAEETRRGAQAQRYLRGIDWANTRPVDPDGAVPAATRWSFQLRFDYGDFHPEDPTPEPERDWPARPDPFSVASAGFEIRTWRLCRRLLLFHDFAGLGPEPVLTRTFDFAYDERPEGSRLTAITKTGYRSEDGARREATVPPLTFAYSEAQLGRSFARAPETLEAAAPAGTSTSRTRLVDLYGEGLPGILYDDPAGWFYRRNLGGGRFAEARPVNARPAHSLAAVMLGDFDGDGNMDAVVPGGQGAGAYTFDRESGTWSSFRPFAEMPRLGGSARAQRLDLTGDGRADLVAREDDRLLVYAARGALGFAAEPIEARLDAAMASGPAGAPPFAADPAQDYLFADMTGDGLADQVLVRNGLVAYWPNLGHGRFGRPVLMENAPEFAHGRHASLGRVLLADLDGSGTADLIYLGEGQVQIWTNASGNAFTSPRVIDGLPMIDERGVVEVLDILGDGTKALVWNANCAGAAAALQMLALSDDTPPGLLSEISTNTGRVERIHYGHSVRHYRRDQETERAWSTRLPTHVVTVDRLTSHDLVTGTVHETRFAYRDGARDSHERGFAGFGEVDVVNAAFQHDPDDPLPVSAPALTRCFFDQGLDDRARQRFWSGDPGAVAVVPFAFAPPSGVDADTWRDARAALRGRVLREEVYAVGPEGPAPVPLTVSNTGFEVELLQKARPRRSRDERRPQAERAVLAVFERENVTSVYEGQADDPRVMHSFVLDHDAHGAVTLVAKLAYPRRPGQPIADPAQARSHCEVKRMRAAHMDGADVLALNQPVEQEEFAVAGLEVPERGWFRPAEIAASVTLALAAPLTHDKAETPGRARRTSWSRNVYWNDAATAALPLGETAQPPLLHHTETAAFSEDFARAEYGAEVNTRLAELGYVADADHWWRATETLLYLGAERFRRAAGHRRPGGAEVRVDYDEATLFATTVSEPNGASTTSEIDYQALASRRSESPTGAWRETVFDALGMPVRAAYGGSVLDADGVLQPYGFDPPARDPAPDPAEVLAAPETALAGASQLLCYDLHAWMRDGTPIAQLSVVAADLRHDGGGQRQMGGAPRIEIAYHDGHGQPVVTKRRAGDGPAIARDANGAVMVDETGRPSLALASPRWASTGWIARNGKGETVSSFEPYFSPTPAYEDDAVLRALGAETRTFHDAAGRVVLRLMPDGTMERSEFGPWHERAFDANDTVQQSLWRLTRANRPADDPERRALDGALAHADTPVERVLDPLSRPVQLVEDDGEGNTRRIRSIYLDTDEVAEVIDARGISASRHVYDMLGRKIREAHADAGETRVLYDSADNPVEVTAANGSTQIMTYDAMGRLVAVDLDSGGGDAGSGLRRIESYSYADNPNDPDALGRNLLGELVECRDEGGRTRLLAATPDGQPLVSTRELIADPESPADWSGDVALDPEVFETRFTYDAMARPIAERRADGTTLTARYTEDGGLGTVEAASEDGQLPPTTIVSDATYSVNGQRETLTLGNGVTVKRDYDPATLRVTRITARRPASGGRAPLLQDLAYTYDPVGNITTCRDHAHDPEAGAASAFFTAHPAASATRHYVYDAFYQLVRAEGRAHRGASPGADAPETLSLATGEAVERYTQTYRYDLSGNLTRLRHAGASGGWTTDFQVAAESNRSRPALASADAPAPDLDDDFGSGGELARTAHLARLEWRHDQRLARAVVIDRRAEGRPDDDELYLYDADGRRLKKVTRRLLGNGQIERIEAIYLDGCEIRRIYSGDTLILERKVTRISDGSSEVAEIHRWTRDTRGRETDDTTVVRLRYTLGDHLGSATLRLDEEARIISYEEFLPFGASAFVAGDDAREVALKAYDFIARERDAATGLHYISQRYYASWLCRWISPDPAGDVDGPNLYLYALNNPITNLDPNGLQTREATERGEVRAVAAEGPPQAVHDAFAALPEDEQQRLRGLMDNNNFNWFMGRDGRVHFGTRAEIDDLVQAVLENGEDVAVVVTADAGGEASDEEDGGATARDTDEEAEEEEEENDDSTSPIGNDGGDTDTDQDATETSEDDTEDTEDRRDGEPPVEDPDPNRGQPPGENGTSRDNPAGVQDGTERKTEDDAQDHGGEGNGKTPGARGRGAKGTGLGGGGNAELTGAGKTGRQGRGTAGGSGKARGGGEGGEPSGGSGRPDGRSGGSTNGGESGELPPEGTDPHSGSGGTRVAPPGVRPNRDAGPDGDGGPGDEVEGEESGSAPPGQAADEGQAGGGGQEPATVMDHVTRVAGWWHLQFSAPPGGQSGGIPGGMGNLNLGAWGQAAFVLLTVADIALTILTLGGLAALKTAFTTALRVGLRTLASVGRKALQAISLRNLRSIAMRAASRMSIYKDNILRWLAFDYSLQSRFYYAMMAKGGWRARLVDSRFGRWFLYGMNPGAGAHPAGTGTFLGFWRYQKTTVVNNATRWANKIDNTFHEGFHVVTDLLLYPVNGLRNKMVRGQPVFAVVNYLDELGAYSIGRIASGRFHALPMAPLNAFNSVYAYYHMMGGQALARKAIGWSVAGIGVLGSGGYGAYRLLGDRDGQPEPEPGR